MTTATSNKVILDFYAIGLPTGLSAVDLMFKDAKTQISVKIPKDLNSSTLQKISFTCHKLEPVEKTTRTASLSVTAEQIRNLTLSTGVFGRVPLEIPAKLEAGQIYNLIVSSERLSLSARIVSRELLEREEAMGRVFGEAADFLSMLSQNMHGFPGEGLSEMFRSKGEQMHRSFSKGELGDLSPSATTGDLLSYGMQKTIEMCQNSGFPIRVPDGKPSETPADLDRLSDAELKSRLEAELEIETKINIEFSAILSHGDSTAATDLLKSRYTNIESIRNIEKALEKRGIASC